MKPLTSRPHMPGYGIAGPDEGKGLLPWNWAVLRLTKAHNYWIATTRPDGRPHLMAIWGVWLDDAFYFSTDSGSRKARNLAESPNCVVSTERGDEAVIVEGTAKRARRGPALEKAIRLYRRKYGWTLDPKESPLYIVRPSVAFGFIETADDFVNTATRWKF